MKHAAVRWYSWYGILAARAGAWPARRVTWGLVLIFSVWVLLDVLVFKFSGGLAKSSFDAMVRARVYVAAPDPRIVIIDIDEASLERMGKEFGRWPWPRDTLATVLAHIERQQPAAIVWDVVFSDADRLNPGGDAAFNEAVKRSLHSHFSVVRLPPANDAASQMTRAVLPGLWIAPEPASVSAPAPTATVALIPPALPAIAVSRLGFNNGYVDPDGVLRRYRYLEHLPDGSAIQSIAFSVLNAIDLVAYRAYVTRATGQFYSKDELVTWRKRADAYPRVSFADVFAQAEGVPPSAAATAIATAQPALPTWAGKVIIIGSTAPSLHDIHPTPLSSTQAGVDTLATALDNALNQRHLHELPRWVQAGLAIVLCVGLGLWVQFKSVASLAPALLALPAALLSLSYISLNGLPVFLDLHLAAGLVLLFLAVLRYWSTLRRNYWCSPPPPCAQPFAIWVWQRDDAWLEGPLDRLIDRVQRHAPSCRVVACDASATWPSTLRWPELSRFAAVVGPYESMMMARAKLEPALKRVAHSAGEPVLLATQPDRDNLANHVMAMWATIQKSQA